MARQAEIDAVIESWRRSGKSRIAFARESGIAISTLQRWIRRADGQQEEPTAEPATAVLEAPPAFVEIAQERPVGQDCPVAPERPVDRQPDIAMPRVPRLRLDFGDGVILTLY